MTTSSSGIDSTSRARRSLLVLAASILAASASCAPDTGRSINAPDARRGGIPAWLSRCLDAGAAPVTFGASWPLTEADGTPNVNAPTLDQLYLVLYDVNRGCGLRVGPGTRGSPLALEVRDVRQSPARAAEITAELIGGGAVAVFGASGSGATTAAAQVAVNAQVPFGANQAAADALSGCTPAELADPSVIKSPTPVYGPGQCWDHGGFFVRMATTGYLLGSDGAAYARETYPNLTTAAILHRVGPFGEPNRDGIRDKFVELGGTIVGEAGFVTNVPTKDDFKVLLQAVTAENPSLLLGSTNVPGLRAIVQAFVELRDDPTWAEKPAGFDALRFVWTSTLGDDYGDLGSTALEVLASQAEFLSTSWDATSIPYQRWFALYRSFDPTAPPPSSAFYMAAFDAAMVVALAMTAAGTTDGPAAAAKIQEVANPPGTVICPGQWRKAFRLLAKGKDIDYEGARGGLNVDQRGNATNVPAGLFRFLPDGPTELVRTFGAGPQVTCDDGEPGGDDDDDDDDD